MGLRASVLLILGAFLSAFLVVSSVSVTVASQGTLSLRRRFGRGDFIFLVEMRRGQYAIFWSCFGGERAKPPKGRQFRRAVGYPTVLQQLHLFVFSKFAQARLGQHTLQAHTLLQAPFTCVWAVSLAVLGFIT
jgi:hypothetical protein